MKIAVRCGVDNHRLLVAELFSPDSRDLIEHKKKVGRNEHGPWARDETRRWAIGFEVLDLDTRTVGFDVKCPRHGVLTVPADDIRNVMVDKDRVVLGFPPPPD